MWMRALFGMTSLVAVVGMLWGSVTPASACSCVPTTASPYDRADTVVIGTVVRMVKSDASAAPGIPVEDLDAVIAVEEYLKGAGPPETVADDPPHGHTCGFFDESSVGRRYVVHLSDAYSPNQTGYCSGNYELAVGGGGGGGPTPTVISAAQPIEHPPDPPGWGSVSTPSSYFGDGTPAPGPVNAASSGDSAPGTNFEEGTQAGPIAGSPSDRSEPSNAEGIAARFDGGGGGRPTSADTAEQFDEESDVALMPIVAAVAAPLAFLVGAAFLWRRGGRQRMGSG